MKPREAYELLEAIAIISDSQDKLTLLVDDVSQQAHQQNKKRPSINFEECGIPIGAELVYIEDPTVIVTVESPRKVIYNNEITSLSAVVGGIKGVKSIAGPSYFTYNGRLITDIANETQWKDY